MGPRLLDQINNIFLVVFVVLVALAIFRITKRYLAYRHQGLSIPALLPRDLFLFSGLGLPFFGTLIFRSFSITPKDEAWYPFWVIFSGCFGILGVAYWVWFEYFRIER